MQIVPPQLSLPSTVALVGAGNIGSFTIDALGRVRGLERVVLVDPGFYDKSNLPSQRITARDVGKAKAMVQGKRLREINPALEVTALVESIANVPRGLLRGAVVMTALDSAAARRDACEAAWRVGATVIDGGVEPEMGLGRVTVYQPGPDTPCFECQLESSDYEAMPAQHVCGEDGEDETPTNGSASLGALVASHLVIEAEKLLIGKMEGSLAGKQLVFDVTHHNQFITRLDRNPCCRFDHARRDIRAVAGVTERTTLGAALEAARAALGTNAKVSLGVDGRHFARALHCPGCGGAKDLLALPERLPLQARSCAACNGREMLALGFKQLDRISGRDVPARSLRRSLRSLGIRTGDVLVASDGEQDNYFEVTHA
jgi:molybdopterin/thiamine biosynthesis adenylyltransferase